MGTGLYLTSKQNYMNWFVIIIVTIICIAVVVFTIFRNQKDEKEFEEHVKDDYPKPHHDKADADPEETPQ